jgi:hypothetical protein
MILKGNIRFGNTETWPAGMELTPAQAEIVVNLGLGHMIEGEIKKPRKKKASEE